MRFFASVLTAVLLSCLAVDAAEKPARLDVYPATAELDGRTDRQRFVVQAVYPAGITRDVTRHAQISFADPKYASVKGAILAPLADGKTTMTISFDGKTAKLPVSVANSGVRRPVSFRLDVMPTFMRAGCNTGACHGSARGQDGFHLSLFGYDPEGDYHRLTREMVGRRINVAMPEHSLLLEKAIGAVNHTGGEMITTDSRHYKTLLEWIRTGAKDDKADMPEATGIKLMPEKILLRENAEKPAKHSTTVLATYSDGSTRDITHLAVFLSNNEGTAQINEHGMITAGVSGEAYAFARFDKFTVGSEVVVLPNRPFTWPKLAEHNYIDKHVFNKLKRLQILPSELCTDQEFLRRAYLDIIGSLPSVETYNAFIKDSNPGKRAALIDELLARDEHDDLWAMKWGELLQIATGRQQPRSTRPRKGVWGYHEHIRKSMGEDKPVDKLVRELITAGGSNISSPLANFYTASDRLEPLKIAENVAQQFMGIRIQCAQCHNHPFDRWTMDDYYSFTGFFEGINYKSGAGAFEAYVQYDKNKIGSKHPVYKKNMPLQYLGGEQVDIQKKDPRPQLAEWMTSPENTLFAENFANRTWAHFFGRGIVEPVDDIRITNPPANRELLDALAAKLVEYDYNMKRLIKDITMSRTYQLSSRTNESNKNDVSHFAYGAVRRLQAEVLIDSISSATETTAQFTGYPARYRATQLFQGGGSDYFLTTFGSSRRQSVCACEVKKDATLSQALELINGSYLERAFRTSPVIAKMLGKKQPPEAIVTELYIRTLTRKPTDGELQTMLKLIGGKNKADRTAYEDVLWSLVNSTEFSFNH
jgi:hypothetical protein